jgi:hypothetical protein
MSVLLPIPGSPPMSTIEPGTMPPPSTRSNSPMPDGTRAASLTSTASHGTAPAPGSSASVAWRALPPEATSWRSSTKLFHSPQSGQRPSHFELSNPQAWQTKTERSLLTAAA